MAKVKKANEGLYNQVREEVSKMTVAEMRKQATVYGLKNAKQYKRAELEEKLTNRIAEAKAAVEAEAQAKAKEAKKAAKGKAAKANDKDKRYKATKLEAGIDIDALADEIIADGFKGTDPYQVNRKVLIAVMKKLHCNRWYRTYDKPTMLAMINEKLAGQ